MTEAAQLRPLAVIREAECIGCAKCIQACPVDAILGSAKKMHTVIAEECIGCKLCLPPCPVDCIELAIPANTNSELDSPEARKQKAAYIKKRFSARKKRLQHEEEQQFPSLGSLPGEKELYSGCSGKGEVEEGKGMNLYWNWSIFVRYCKA